MFERLGGFFGGGNKNEGRQNDGGDFMTVPGPENPTSKEEAVLAEERRLEIERLEKLTTDIEQDPNHPQKGELRALNDQLRELEEPFRV